MAEGLIEEIEALDSPHYVVARRRRQPAHLTRGRRSPDRWLGTCDELDAIVARVRPSRIVVAIENRRDRLPLQSLLESRVSGIDVDDAIEFYERITGKIAIEALRPSTLILSKGFRNHGAAEIAARLVSIVVAAVGLILCGPAARRSLPCWSSSTRRDRCSSCSSAPGVTAARSGC